MAFSEVLTELLRYNYLHDERLLDNNEDKLLEPIVDEYADELHELGIEAIPVKDDDDKRERDKYQLLLGRYRQHFDKLVRDVPQPQLLPLPEEIAEAAARRVKPKPGSPEEELTGVKFVIALHVLTKYAKKLKEWKAKAASTSFTKGAAARKAPAAPAPAAPRPVAAAPKWAAASKEGANGHAPNGVAAATPLPSPPAAAPARDRRRHRPNPPARRRRAAPRQDATRWQGRTRGRLARRAS